MNSNLSRAKAITAVKIIENLRARDGQFFQNKRSECRDLKWDYLDVFTAKKISAALSKADIPHDHRRVGGRYGGGPHYQIRLRAPIDFSLLEVKGRRVDAAKRRKEREKAKRFNDKLHRALRRLNVLRHDRRGDGIKLTRVIRALRGRS